MGETKQVLTAEEIAAMAMAFRHPLDEGAACRFHALSRLTGLQRTGVNLIRVAPGMQAFPLHRHYGEEEWTFVISGQAEVIIGEKVTPLGPGGFAAFPPAGPAHAVRNASETEDLVCLTGGNSDPLDVVEFPTLGQRVVRNGQSTEIAPEEGFSQFDFLARTGPAGPE